MPSNSVQILLYQTESGKRPYDLWVGGLKDQIAKSAILGRVHMLESKGNLGNSKSVGDGVFELKIDVGQGYRVYLGFDGAKVVILLCGGDKSTQKNDIKKAQKYFMDYKRRSKK